MSYKVNDKIFHKLDKLVELYSQLNTLASEIADETDKLLSAADNKINKSGDIKDIGDALHEAEFLYDNIKTSFASISGNKINDVLNEMQAFVSTYQTLNSAYKTAVKSNLEQEDFSEIIKKPLIPEFLTFIKENPNSTKKDIIRMLSYSPSISEKSIIKNLTLLENAGIINILYTSLKDASNKDGFYTIAPAYKEKVDVLPSANQHAPIMNEQYKYSNMDDLITDLAESVRKIYDIKLPVTDIDEIVKKIGGTVKYVNCYDMSEGIISDGADGFTIYIWDGNEHYTKQRQIYRIAQELGRLFITMGYKINDEMWNKWKKSGTLCCTETAEQTLRHQRFAKELLMPKDMYIDVMNRCSNGNSVYSKKMAEEFNLPVDIVIQRGQQLGLLSTLL